MWHDAEGNPHTIEQTEGGEQGDPLMPHCIVSISAFLDDVYAVAPPHRVRPVLDLLQHQLSRHAHVPSTTAKPAQTSDLSAEEIAKKNIISPLGEGHPFVEKDEGTEGYRR